MTDNERSQSNLQEMVMLGKDYREDLELELYGAEVTGVIRPLPDQEFLPILAFLAEHLGYDEELEEVEAEVVDDAMDEIEDARDDGGSIDASKLDDEFIAIMQNAAILGLEGAYDDGEYVDHTDEEVEEIVTSMLGGKSIELGGEVLDLSGNIEEAEKFREHWGRQRRGGDS